MPPLLVRISAGLALTAGSAQALLLGGQEVPREKIILYFFIGHSNMAGEDTRNSDGTAHPRVWNYEWFRNREWVPAREIPGGDRNGLGGRGEGGPAMPFLKAMAQAYPGYYFASIHNAIASSTLRGLNRGHNGSGLPADSNRYWKGARLYNEIAGAGKAVAGDVTFGGVLCMLGTVEATRTSEEVCRAFSEDARQMVADLRADLGAPNLPFLIGEYEAGATGDFALTMPWPKIVDAQIKAIPSKLPFSATVNSQGIPMADGHHYTLAGTAEWARRAADTIRTRGWMPPPSMGNHILPRARGIADADRYGEWDFSGVLFPYRHRLVRMDGRRVLLPDRP